MDNELDRFLVWVSDMLGDAASAVDKWGVHATDKEKKKGFLKEEVKKFEDAATLVRKYIKDGK